MDSATAIKQAFDGYFASYRMAFPEECLARRDGGFECAGWEVRYRFGRQDGADYLELFATHRMTNDRLCRGLCRRPGGTGGLDH